MNISNGVLVGSSWCASPNFNSRPQGEVSLLVLHNISLPPGQFGTGAVRQFFTNQLDPKAHPYFAEIEAMQVSSHLLIERTGAVTQFVNFNERAWHAGKSYYQGRDNCNDFSIGIELEGTDKLPYTDQQYQVLNQVVLAIMQAYPAIVPSRITGHEQIAPQRKTDPGSAFDWQRFFSGLYQARRGL